MNDKIEEIIFKEFQQWIYNDENQAGDKLQVIDASDLPGIITEVVKTLAMFKVIAPSSGVSSYFSFVKYMDGWYEYTDNTDKGDVYNNIVTGRLMTEQQIFDEWLNRTGYTSEL
jgi:hypothetical protein